MTMPTLFLIVFALLLEACSHSGTSGPFVEVSVRDLATSSVGTNTVFPSLNRWVLPALRAETSGQNRSQDLVSLKYFIRTIAVCETLTVTAATYSNPTTCLTFYSRLDNPGYDYILGTDYSPLADVARQDTANFVDLMTTAGKSALGTSFQLSRSHVGIYNWGYISYYPAVKFNATVVVNNGATTQSYYTHDGTTSHLGSGVHVTETTTNFSNGTPGEATVLLSTGGTWFRLQTPLTISHSDIDAGSRFSLDLFLNSDATVKAHSNDLTLTSNYLLRDASTVSSSNKMTFTPLELTPMARGYRQAIVKESYLMDFSAVAGVTDRFNLRFDLLYASEDETKAIGGIESRVFYRIVGQDSSLFTVTEIPDFPRISSFTRNSDGTFNFLLPDGTVIIQNFSRLTTVNSSGTATFRCSSFWTPSSCSGSLSVPFTLRALSTL